MEHSRERDFLTWLRTRLPAGGPGELWIGDDAAVLTGEKGSLVWTVDFTIDKVHVDLELMAAADVGFKAMNRALSDVAAMGAAPWRALISVATPGCVNLGQFYDGVSEASELLECPLVGGDLAREESGRLVISITALGQVPFPERPVARSGARSGDALWVTGPLGGASAGLGCLRALAGQTRSLGAVGARPTSKPVSDQEQALIAAYVRPLARIREGIAARKAGARAMIDVSDGLVTDLAHLAEESSVGIDLHHVPIAQGASMVDALGGGDDYELLISAPPEVNLAEVFVNQGLRKPTLIGRVNDNSGVVTLDGEVLPRLGWEHSL